MPIRSLVLDKTARLFFPVFPFDACNLDSRCITRNFPEPKCSNDGDTLAYPSRLPLCSFFFASFFFLYGRCIFLPAGVKLFQDASGRFIRSRKREQDKETKREREGRGKREVIDRAIRSPKDYKPPALRRASNMKYATAKRNRRILQITAPMWSVAKHFGARRASRRVNESNMN